jgi:AraC family transcriptional regulator
MAKGLAQAMTMLLAGKQGGIEQMTSRGFAGERFARNFRTDEPKPPIVTGLGNGQFAAARIVHSGPTHGVSQIPAQDAFVLAYLMTEFPNSALWVGGRPTKWDPIRAGQIRFYNLERGIDGYSINSGTAFDDPIISHLGRTLLPALERPTQANQLFIDQAAFTLQAHFAYRYARLRNRGAFYRGGLTPSQERRAKELIRAHIDGTISVERLAQECGLSRSQFFRAFKWTTGKTPHGWLIQSRVEMSKELLLTSGLSLAEVASACGFANPSHFTRVFARYVGTAPGVWRAIQRS